MKNFFTKRLNAVLSVALVIISIFVVFQTAFASTLNAGESEQKTQEISNVNPNLAEIMEEDGIELTTTQPTTEKTEATKPTKATKATEATKKKTSKKQTTTSPSTTAPIEATVQFATAIPPKVKADYNAQWNAGYLVAIDNPDPTYKCGQVTLCDEDRDLLERLCMGEFGSGGFVGAALIAQAVKNAMCFDGYTSVAEVIECCKYTGRTDVGTNEACKQAVRYIFDENHDAVQHRIMYMYNPYLVQSAFHESQNYILTYQQVRFFDRWNY